MDPWNPGLETFEAWAEVVQQESRVCWPAQLAITQGAINRTSEPPNKKQELFGDGRIGAVVIDKKHKKWTRWSANRALFMTREQLLGTTFFTVQAGDVVVEFENWGETVVLRQVGNYYELIDQSFILGMTPGTPDAQDLEEECLQFPKRHFLHCKAPVHENWQWLTIK